MGSRFGMHLTPEQLVDAAEAAPDRPIDPHLETCAACRARFVDLRATMSTVGEIGGAVPEPSPLFWDHFQQRVVAAAHVERRREGIVTRLARSLGAAIMVPASAALLVAVGMLVMNVNWSRHAPAVAGPGLVSSPDAGGGAAASRAELLRDSMDDDPSLQLIADLAVDVDWNGADAASLAPNGSAEHAVSHLDARDLKELQRLLRAELGT